MAEYVNKTKILDHLKDVYEQIPLKNESRQLIAAFKVYIENRPTADVQEVRHGRWEDMSDIYDKGKDLRCSLCHRRASAFVGGSEDWWDMWEPDFCPHCGADMRGDDNDV